MIFVIHLGFTNALILLNGVISPEIMVINAWLECFISEACKLCFCFPRLCYCLTLILDLVMSGLLLSKMRLEPVSNFLSNLWLRWSFCEHGSLGLLINLTTHRQKNHKIKWWAFHLLLQQIVGLLDNVFKNSFYKSIFKNSS